MSGFTKQDCVGGAKSTAENIHHAVADSRWLFVYGSGDIMEETEADHEPELKPESWLKKERDVH